MRAYRVGLTGGLASGKSTVAGWLREAGFPVYDADKIVADLYRPGQPGAAAVVALFGPTALHADGSVDRRAVAARVFSDDDVRRRLEAAIHPLVRQRSNEIAAATDGPVVFEATLIVVTVEADPELRLRRAVERGLDEPAARARLAAQGDGARRRAGAHRVITNDGDLADLRRQVDTLIEDIRKQAAAR
jgi:dephospho-CoA kinase